MIKNLNGVRFLISFSVGLFMYDVGVLFFSRVVVLLWIGSAGGLVIQWEGDRYISQRLWWYYITSLHDPKFPFKNSIVSNCLSSNGLFAAFKLTT